VEPGSGRPAHGGNHFPSALSVFAGKRETKSARRADDNGAPDLRHDDPPWRCSLAVAIRAHRDGGERIPTGRQTGLRDWLSNHTLSVIGQIATIFRGERANGGECWAAGNTEAARAPPKSRGCVASHVRSRRRLSTPRTLSRNNAIRRAIRGT
jgi:hypothetical protein